MNFHRLLSRPLSVCTGNYINVRRPAHTLTKADTEIELLTKQDPQLSQVSGITVASVENFSPLTEISVAIKAGSRYEKAHEEGVVHCLRNFAVLSTKNNSQFMLTRSLEMIGAKISTTSTREHLIYSIKCQRDNIDAGLQILADIVQNPALKAHQVTDSAPSLHVDLALHNCRPEAVLMEALHKAAFRGGLSNSLYTPHYLIGKHTPEKLSGFIRDNFSSSRTSVVGLGISHECLEQSVGQLFNMQSSGAGNNAPSKFVPGEVRISADMPMVHAAIVAEGAGFTNSKEMLSLALLQCMLGEGSKFSPLAQAAANVCSNNPFYVSGLSVNYSDTGLFGVYLTGLPQDMKSLVKAVVTAMRDLPKSISESAVTAAKHKLKAKLLIERDSDLLSAMVSDVSLHGNLRDVKDLEKSIDELQTADIAAIASKVVKSKPAMAALGQLHSTPFVDELL